MVPAANIPILAQNELRKLLEDDVRELNVRIGKFLFLIKKKALRSPKQAQTAFTILKLQFNALLDRLDIFADVVNQRSEHETGVWMAGLDILAKDALKIKGNFFKPPPLITYLDRGHGAAIRRARTRLPGGKSNPVAVIRVPRERMVSSGIASSLIHEVGHQGAALLGLIPSLRKQLVAQSNAQPTRSKEWGLLDRWISEILSDFWSVAQVGIGASTGLIGVVSLPTYFVFRMNIDDPHPFPWIRVKISLAFGKALYPDPQWKKLERLWEKLYPTENIHPSKRNLLQRLETIIPDFVQLVLKHRSKTLHGQSLQAVFPIKERQPQRLRRLFQQWQQRPNQMLKARPSLVFAVMGQARTDGVIQPQKESLVLRGLLTRWALHRHQPS